MNKYQILKGPALLGKVKAETAREALDVFCAKRPNSEVGFQTGGLEVDAATRGREWASVRTMGGRLMAEAIQ